MAMARVLTVEPRFEDAERDASASLRLGGDNAKAYFRRGSARKQLARWDEARQGG